MPPVSDLSRLPLAEALFRAAPSAMIAVAADAPRFTILAASRRYLQAAPVPAEELIGRGVFEVFPEDQPGPAGAAMRQVRASLMRVLETGRSDALPLQRYDVGQSERWWAPVNTPVRDAEGRVVAIIHKVGDVTQRKRDQASLDRRLHQLQALAEAALVVAQAPDLAATLDEVTRAARRIIGAHQAVVSLSQGHDWAQAVTTVDLTDAYAAWRGYDVRPDGSGIYAWVCEQNQAVRFTQAELEAHPRWRGFGAEAGRHPPMRGWLAAPLIGRDGRNRGLIQLTDREDGGEFDAADQAVLVQFAQLASAAVEQAETDAALRASEARFRAVQDTSIDGFMVLESIRDADGGIDDFRWVYANAAAERIVGRSREWFLGRRLLDEMPGNREQGLFDAYVRVVETGEPFTREFTYRQDGVDAHLRLVAARANDGFAVSFADLTERRLAEERVRQSEQRLRELNDTLEIRIAAAIEERERAEAALRQAQKMEAVGQLTGGIAHDFNNLLTVVAGNIEIAARRLEGGDPDGRAARALENARQGAERAAALTQRLLAFSRRQALAPMPLDAAQLVADMSDLLVRSLGETVELRVEAAPDLWTVEVDPHQLEASILNLAVNARDAMPRGGRLTLSLANVVVGPGDGLSEGAPGDHLRIAASDTGVGMAPDVIARVFEPFFTTKEVGKGTGLGLSMVYGFVRQSGGQVAVRSAPGEGTTVEILLPRAQGAPVAAPAEPPAAAPPGQAGETILVVEDDPEVCAYTVECLRELGYRVLAAADGAEALQRLEGEGDGVQLMLTDVVMPGMSGRELAEAALRLRPRLKVLYTSGYARDAIAPDGRLEPGVQILAKPFSYAALGAQVRQALDAG